MSTVMRCAGARQGELLGRYLRAYDLEAHEGRGQAEWTRDKREAMRFPSFTAAFEAWRSVSVTVPVRPDGKPNKPLTAYTVEFEEMP